MCGIFGVLGQNHAAPVVLEALKRLEYRGYDSAGIAAIHDGEIRRCRAVGKLMNLEERLMDEPLLGNAAIGHTRWATHGAASLENAHPHQSGRVAVVHNGIIENHASLRAELAGYGYEGFSDTDTEVVALLVARYLDTGLDEISAAYQAVSRLEGAFALAFLFAGENDLMVVARRGSPLAIGLDDEQVFVGSDAIALSGLTNRVIYLEEGDFAVLDRNTITIADAEGQEVERQVTKIETDKTSYDKSGHEYFMAKEIEEQPKVLRDVIDHYLGKGSGELDQIDFSVVGRILLVACGTAYHACLTARHWIETISGIPVDLDVASEFRYREPPLGSDTLAIFVSQSGETADTLAALRYARGKAGCILSLVNAEQSSIARESDIALPLLVGAEIGVASTKAYTGQLTVLAHLAFKAAQDRGRDVPSDANLLQVPTLVEDALDCEAVVAQIAHDISNVQHALFIGRGSMHPLALEGALKLKEISYIHAEGYASGELKHGPIALVDDQMPIFVFAPTGPLYQKTASNMAEVIARGGKVILVSDQAGIEEAGKGPWATILMPDVPEALAPIVYAIPAQLLAYHAAIAKGADVDKPRNLAKAVSVE
jgi:glutamine---fructose-6-phosphate transaminase (isomerizing)